MNIQIKECGNCLFQSELIMWENRKDGNYLPNYDKRLTCCTALVRLPDGSNVVYGHTDPHDYGFCEMWKERSVRKNRTTENE